MSSLWLAVHEKNIFFMQSVGVSDRSTRSACRSRFDGSGL